MLPVSFFFFFFFGVWVSSKVFSKKAKYHTRDKLYTSEQVWDLNFSHIYHAVKKVNYWLSYAWVWISSPSYFLAPRIQRYLDVYVWENMCLQTRKIKKLLFFYIIHNFDMRLHGTLCCLILSILALWGCLSSLAFGPWIFHYFLPRQLGLSFPFSP